MSYEKDLLNTFITSASSSAAIAAALVPYVTSNSLSAALAGLGTSNFVTSNSISAAVATNTLTVRGTASVSATMSAGAMTIAGRPVSAVVLGYQALTGVGPWGFSGSWSDIQYMEINAVGNFQSSLTASVAIFTDGGTTPMLSARTNNVVPSNVNVKIKVEVMGTSGGNAKGVEWTSYNPAAGGSAFVYSATSNTGIVNCIRIGSTLRTASFGSMILIGYRSA